MVSPNSKGQHYLERSIFITKQTFFRRWWCTTARAAYTFLTFPIAAHKDTVTAPDTNHAEKEWAALIVGVVTTNFSEWDIVAVLRVFDFRPTTVWYSTPLEDINFI